MSVKQLKLYTLPSCGLQSLCPEKSNSRAREGQQWMNPWPPRLHVLLSELQSLDEISNPQMDSITAPPLFFPQHNLQPACLFHFFLLLLLLALELLPIPRMECRFTNFLLQLSLDQAHRPALPVGQADLVTKLWFWLWLSICFPVETNRSTLRDLVITRNR
jgi:hypothetical protein